VPSATNKTGAISAIINKILYVIGPAQNYATSGGNSPFTKKSGGIGSRRKQRPQRDYVGPKVPAFLALKGMYFKSSVPLRAAHVHSCPATRASREGPARLRFGYL
jgi:hypothetical protein